LPEKFDEVNFSATLPTEFLFHNLMEGGERSEQKMEKSYGHRPKKRRKEIVPHPDKFFELSGNRAWRSSDCAFWAALGTY
jgi:hypothetical protein